MVPTHIVSMKLYQKILCFLILADCQENNLDNLDEQGISVIEEFTILYSATFKSEYILAKGRTIIVHVLHFVPFSSDRKNENEWGAPP